MNAGDRGADEFESHRARLVGLGYRMLGSRAEAEDLVQETYLRWRRTPRDDVREPGAWLRTTMTRLCIDELRARQAHPVEYVGPWLPEPWLSGAADDAESALELADDLSVAFLLLLERLAPEERAAFLLHDVFDAGYPDIAAALGRNEAAVRQIVSRARARVVEQRPRFRVSPAEAQSLAERFQLALRSRDDAELLTLLRPEAVLVSDGGGKVLAALRPIVGAEKICRFFMGVTRDQSADDFLLQSQWINGAPGFVVRERSGTPIATFAFEVQEGRIARIFAVRNPDKLRHLTVPVAAWAPPPQP
ncbi:MAG: RNA polymerase sigma factor SigJ [Pseudomonadales bacterium]